MNPLSGFSDWVLALLPRLFLIPGGACLLLAFVLHYLARSNFRLVSPRSTLRAFLRANTLAFAISWTATALLPFAGMAPLPFPVDTFALMAMPIASLALDLFSGHKREPQEIGGMLVITIAVLSFVLQERRLLITNAAAGAHMWLALGAIAGGLVALVPSVERSVSGAMRWVALGGIGLALGTSLSLVVAIGILAGVFAVGLVAARVRWDNGALVLAYALATGAVLIQLFQP